MNSTLGVKSKETLPSTISTEASINDGSNEKTSSGKWGYLLHILT